MIKSTSKRLVVSEKELAFNFPKPRNWLQKRSNQPWKGQILGRKSSYLFNVSKSWIGYQVWACTNLSFRFFFQIWVVILIFFAWHLFVRRSTLQIYEVKTWILENFVYQVWACKNLSFRFFFFQFGWLFWNSALTTFRPEVYTTDFWSQNVNFQKFCIPRFIATN